MSQVVKVKRSALLVALVYVGYKNAPTWPDEKIVGKIPTIPDVMTADQASDPNRPPLLDELLKGLKDGTTFEVEADVPVSDKPAKEKSPEGAAAGTDGAAAGGEKPKKKWKRKKKDENAKTYARVRPGRTTMYIAAEIIKKHGLEGGVTDAMVQEYNTARGRTNYRIAELMLVRAWHALNGYANIVPVSDEVVEGDGGDAAGGASSSASGAPESNGTAPAGTESAPAQQSAPEAAAEPAKETVPA